MRTEENANTGAPSPTQNCVLAFVGAGLPSKMIAHEMGVSEATITTHVGALLRVLGATNRMQLILRCHGVDAEAALAAARALAGGRKVRRRRA